MLYTVNKKRCKAKCYQVIRDYLTLHCYYIYYNIYYDCPLDNGSETCSVTSLCCLFGFLHLPFHFVMLSIIILSSLSIIL